MFEGMCRTIPSNNMPAGNHDGVVLGNFSVFFGLLRTVDREFLCLGFHLNSIL